MSEPTTDDFLRILAHNMDCRDGAVWVGECAQLHGSTKSASLISEDGEELATGTLAEVVVKTRELGYLP